MTSTPRGSPRGYVSRNLDEILVGTEINSVTRTSMNSKLNTLISSAPPPRLSGSGFLDKVPLSVGGGDDSGLSHPVQRLPSTDAGLTYPVQRLPSTNYGLKYPVQSLIESSPLRKAETITIRLVRGVALPSTTEKPKPFCHYALQVGETFYYYAELIEIDEELKLYFAGIWWKISN